MAILKNQIANNLKLRCNHTIYQLIIKSLISHFKELYDNQCQSELDK